MDLTAVAVAIVSLIELVVLLLLSSGPAVGGVMVFALMVALVAGLGSRIALALTTRTVARRMAILASRY